MLTENITRFILEQSNMASPKQVKNEFDPFKFNVFFLRIFKHKKLNK